MTVDAIYEERESHWSQHVSAMATTRWLQRVQTLPLCEGCGLRDYVYVVVTSPLFTVMSDKHSSSVNNQYNVIHPLRVGVQL